MKLWYWFCRLGKSRDSGLQAFKNPSLLQEKSSQSGTDVCTRLCGKGGCGCGGTMRGQYCIWSYYRMD